MGRAARPNERERMSQSVRWRIRDQKSAFRSQTHQNRQERLRRTFLANAFGVAQFAEWSEWDERHGRQSDERRSERARAASEFQIAEDLQAALAQFAEVATELKRPVI